MSRKSWELDEHVWNKIEFPDKIVNCCTHTPTNEMLVWAVCGYIRAQFGKSLTEQDLKFLRVMEEFQSVDVARHAGLSEYVLTYNKKEKREFKLFMTKDFWLSHLVEQKISKYILYVANESFSDVLREIIPYRLEQFRLPKAVKQLAKGIQISHDMSAATVIRDWLEENNGPEKLIKHFKQPVHYYGCWAIQAIIGSK